MKGCDIMQVDLKPEELLKYNGISPKPDDFDEFWDTSIDEMKTILASYNIERGYVSVYHIEIMSSYYEEIEDYNEIRDIFWGD